MPRSNRYILPGCIYHVTHRRHGRRFLLRFGADRTYRKNRNHTSAKVGIRIGIEYLIT